MCAPERSKTIDCRAPQAARAARLEAELRAAKRREEKLAALQFRLREDVKAAGTDVRWASLPWLWGPTEAPALMTRPASSTQEPLLLYWFESYLRYSRLVADCSAACSVVMCNPCVVHYWPLAGTHWFSASD